MSAVDLLNNTASSFFAMNQRLLINEIFLSIARITVPLETVGKQNLTIRRFINLSDDETAKIIKQDIKELDKIIDGWKDIRHKRFAHKCLEVSLGNLEIEFIDVKKFQTVLDKLVVIINRLRRGTQVDFTVRSPLGGARTLISKLEKQKNETHNQT